MRYINILFPLINAPTLFSILESKTAISCVVITFVFHLSVILFSILEGKLRLK